MEKNNKIIMKKVLKNLFLLLSIILYLVFINYIYINTNQQITANILKIASMVILVCSIAIFEVAYNKDNGVIGISGIELIFIAIYSLTAFNFANKINIEFKKYISGFAFEILIYYILKVIIIYTNEKRKYLKSLSDISEIVENDPVKKKAQKRKNNK